MLVQRSNKVVLGRKSVSAVWKTRTVVNEMSWHTLDVITANCVAFQWQQ